MSNLEEALVKKGLLTPGQLAIAHESQKNLGMSLEQVLVDKGFVTEEALLKALAEDMHTPFVSLAKYKIDPEIVKLLPIQLAKKYRAVSLFKIEDRVTVATSKPLNLAGLDDIESVLQAEVDLVLALESDIKTAIKDYYRGIGLAQTGRKNKVELVSNDEEIVIAESPEKLAKVASGEQVVAAVNNIIAQAIEDKASDIHLEPTREELKVRLRIDGLLEDLSSLPKSIHLPVISRVKIMGNMDVAERRLPQDGRVRVRVAGRGVDMRIATYPTMFGEAAAIRVLSKEQLVTLENLGFLTGDLQIFQKLIAKPHGILLVTGPTGSGKTTTLYASLMRINSKEKHILSIEDPVENEIPGVDQEQVNLKAGMTFATSLRAMLRQDPDVIMVGEIRDFETADIAVRAAMTGHYVFSSLHTNTAIGAVTRLIDLGIEPYLVASTLVGVVAQRLVRKICEHCKTEDRITPEQRKQLGPTMPLTKIYKGAGCEECRQSGYSGRIGLFEIMQVDDEVRVLINKRMPEVRIRERVATLGFHSILEDGLEKVQRGLTTITEVLKVAATA